MVPRSPVPPRPPTSTNFFYQTPDFALCFIFYVLYFGGMEALPQTGERVAMSEQHLHKIGSVMRQTGLSRQTVHNYTVLGLVTEDARTEGGHRLYSDQAIDTLKRVVSLRKRMSLTEIRRLLRQERSGG